MSLVNATNLTAVAGLVYASADTDAIDRQTQVAGWMQVLDAHTHRATYGPGVGRIGSVAPATTGDVQITGDSYRWWAGSTGAIATAVDNLTAQTGLAGAKTWTGAHTFSSTVTAAGDIIFSASNNVRTNTSDGSDNLAVTIAGGGAASQSRGAYITVAGNENASTGKIQLIAGNVTGNAIEFFVGSGARPWNINSSGHFLAGDADNTYDIGASLATRPRTGYFGTSLVVGGSSLATTGTIRLAADSSIYQRGHGDGANMPLIHTDASDNIYLGDAVLGTTTIDSAGNITFRVASSSKMVLNSGLVIGSPTGGDKGAGSINAVTVWRNGTSLDRVFEPGYAVAPIREMRAYYERNHYLPTLRTPDVHEDGSTEMGALGDGLWETVEVHARYIAELEERLRAIESAR